MIASFNHYWQLIVIMACFAVSMPSIAETLSVTMAEQFALQADPLIRRFEQQSHALSAQSVFEGQLPDPKLSFGFANFPTDSFNRGQEAMTQIQLGISQAFPKGESLRFKRQQTETLASIELQRRQLQARHLVQKVRGLFLAIYYQQQAIKIIQESAVIFRQLVKITEAHYAQGRQNQQDVLRAQLELSRLKDKEIALQMTMETKQADLAKWLGEKAWWSLESRWPVFATIPSQAEIEDQLSKHPLILIENAQIQAKQFGVKLSQQQYKPSWGVALNYSERKDRANFLSLMLNVSLPLFPDKRQDKQLAASRKQVMAAYDAKADRWAELKRQLQHQYAQWLRLTQQQRLYQAQLVPEAVQHSQASLNAYQSGVGDFNPLMRAKLLELETRLTALNIRFEKSLAQINLLYLIEQPALDGE